MPKARELTEAALGHHQAGRLDEAERIYRQALELDARDADALHFLGLLQFQRGDAAHAEELISRSLALRQANGHAHYNLGLAQQAQSRLPQAVASFRAALALEPSQPAVHCNLGAALALLGRREEALASYRRALELNPGYFEASYNLGAACRELGRGEEAIAAFRRAIELQPDAAQAHYALGHALRDDDRNDEALASFRRALELDADFAEARWSVAMSQIPSVYAAGEDPAACRARFDAELERLADWFAARRSPRDFAAVGSDQPFGLAYQEDDNRDLLARYGRLCCTLMSDWGASQGIPATPPGARGGGALRVGVVSAHFREHSVWTALTKGWFAHLDPRRIELHAFDLGLGEDQHTRFARQRSASMTGGPRDLAQWVQAIRACRPDVLIYPETGMDPLAARLASLRLAPVQAATWGHPQSTGLPTVDYYLSADGLEPPDAAAHYTEHLVRLHGLGCCVEPRQVRPEEPDFDRWGIDPRKPLFVCPGVPFKYAPQNDGALAAIVQRLGDCQFVFFRYWKEGQALRFEQRLRLAFAARRLDFDRHVRFVPWQPKAAFSGWMRRADAFLDTIGFSGFNTALQAAECALPVVAREGRYLRGRLASGILRRLGLDELVAASEAQYVALAARLVEDAAFSERMTDTLAAKAAGLFADTRPVRELEEFLLSVRS